MRPLMYLSCSVQSSTGERQRIKRICRSANAAAFLDMRPSQASGVESISAGLRRTASELAGDRSRGACSYRQTNATPDGFTVFGPHLLNQ